MQSVNTLLKLAQLRWTGHVTRMPDERLPKNVLYGDLQDGKRSQGGQKKRYKDTLKVSLKGFNIPTESWEQNRLLRIEQNRVASSTKVPPNLKQRESVKLKESVKKDASQEKLLHTISHCRTILRWLSRFLPSGCPSDVYPLTPHFYIENLGCTGVYIFLIFIVNHRFWLHITNMYPQSMFEEKKEKIL